MNDRTARLDLPLIIPGQAGKENAHNEALTRLDMVVQPVVVSVGTITPPETPLPGQAWIVGATPDGAWANHPFAIAGWTAGGWRFVDAREGISASVSTEKVVARYIDGAWTVGELRATRLFIDGVASIGVAQTAVPDPAVGANIDVESRSSIGTILSVLRFHGLIQGAG